MKNIIKTFSLTEKVLFYVLSVIFIISGLTLLYNFNAKFLVEVPERGGTLVEGLIGAPRLINPILAISETDKDLTALVYSGLMRSTPDAGLIADLAESYSVSDDGLEYTFKINDEAVFHDGEPVTADDIIFTIVSAQNPQIKSPKRSNWEGIEIQKINDKEILFRLSKPYAPFLQNMTLGILPKHIWESIDVNEFSLSNANVEPIGTGPYTIDSIDRDSIGIPSSYTLKSFEDFTLGEPYIGTLKFVFAKNQEDLIAMYDARDIDAMHGIDPRLAKEYEDKNARIEHVPLPRIFGVFFNPDQAMVLSSNPVRKALSVVVPKKAIIADVLFGFGSVINNPIPNHIFNNESEFISNTESKSEEELFAEASKILTDSGWTKNENGIWIMKGSEEEDPKILSFSISTGNIPELTNSAKYVIDAWKKLGVQVELKTFEPSDLNSSVIRPRNYDALLFGMVIGRDSDFYAFWHSSQRNDPGLNIAKYANSEVDVLLEDIRKESDADIISGKFMELNNAIRKDVPAVFLYTPEFIYVLPEKVRGFEIKDIVTSEERFLNIHKWFINVDKIWKIFI